MPGEGEQNECPLPGFPAWPGHQAASRPLEVRAAIAAPGGTAQETGSVTTFPNPPLREPGPHTPALARAGSAPLAPAGSWGPPRSGTPVPPPSAPAKGEAGRINKRREVSPSGAGGAFAQESTRAAHSRADSRQGRQLCPGRSADRQLFVKDAAVLFGTKWKVSGAQRRRRERTGSPGRAAKLAGAPHFPFCLRGSAGSAGPAGAGARAAAGPPPLRAAPAPLRRPRPRPHKARPAPRGPHARGLGPASA